MVEKCFRHADEMFESLLTCFWHFFDDGRPLRETRNGVIEAKLHFGVERLIIPPDSDRPAHVI